MFSVVKEWNPKQKLLNSIILKEDKMDESRKLIMELHSMVHSSEVYKTGVKTIEDKLWEGLDKKAFVTMPTKKDVTIAWNLWHITRIEDLIVNVLIAGSAQEFNVGQWHSKLGVKVTDTGNAMSDEEIIDLSNHINMSELRSYRIAVGKMTKEVISNLKASDMRQKVQPDRLERILNEGGVIEGEESRWLLDFWGKKRTAGLILMPLTRHQIVHINDSLKLKVKCSK